MVLFCLRLLEKGGSEGRSEGRRFRLHSEERAKECEPKRGGRAGHAE